MTLTKLLGMRSTDWKVATFLGPVFALVTASTVITISFAKTLFLAHNPTEALPWMFISASLFTMVLAVGYLAIAGTADTGKRLVWMLALAALSFGIVAALSRDRPAEYSLLIYTWTTGIGQLLLIHVWAWSGDNLPTRQARRLFPLFSAVATVGAVCGGLLTRALVRDLGLISLLLVAIVLLLGALVFVKRMPRWDDGETDSAPTDTSTTGTPLKRIPDAVGALRDTPLLAQLATLVFLVQAASLVLDYQFSAAIQMHFDRESVAMAGFLGIYYAVANTGTFLIALVATGKLTRVLGIGLSSASAAIVLVIGGAASTVLAFFALGGVFWSVTATSLGERIVGFAVAKQAMQAAVMPLNRRLAESARFLIDGVVSRVAVVVVSVCLLVFGATLVDVFVLSPMVVAIAILAVLVGRRLAPAYEQTLLQALRQKTLSVGAEFPDWARSAATGVVATDLASNDPREVERGLAIVKELTIPLGVEEARRLLESASPRIVVMALEAMRDQGLKAEQATMLKLLDADAPEEVICAMLRALPRDARHMDTTVEALVMHASDAVSAHAIDWLLTSRSGEPNVEGGQAPPDSSTHAEVPPGSATGATLQYRSPESTETALVDPERENDLRDRHARLVDRIPSLIGSDDAKMRRLALDMLVRLSLPDHMDLLFQALEIPRTRALAMVALAHVPQHALLERLRARLTDDGLTDVNGKIRLVLVAEHIGGTAAAKLIQAQMGANSQALRDQAVKSIWRMTAFDESVLPARTTIKSQAKKELERLMNYAILDGVLSTRSGQRQGLLGGELRLLRAKGERRLFRLLGLAYSREPIERAWLNFRHPDRRTRSNAIELLETTVADPDLRGVVAYAEGTGYQGGRSQTTGRGLMELPAFVHAMSTMAGDGQDDAPLRALLGRTDPWLEILYNYAAAADRGDGDREGGPMSGSHDDVMEKLFLLRRVDLFDQVPADQLLPLAELAVRKSFPANSVIFNANDPGDKLYVVASGEVIVERDRRIVATLGRGHAFGEMAVLDDAARSATVRVKIATECLLIARDEFGELLDIAPGLARGIMRVLAARLRNTLDQWESD
jgi:hypothetical protein